MSMFKKELSTNSLTSIGVILRGGIYSLIISVFLCVFVSLIFYFSNVSESIISWLASILLFASVLLGSAIAVRQVGNKALWHGLGIGILFFIIVLVLTVFFLPEQFSLGGSFSKFILIITAGMLGGILGVFNQT